jgi:hypothetical protein
LVKTGLKGSASIAKPTETAKNASKGAVTDSKTFREGLIYLYQRANVLMAGFDLVVAYGERSRSHVECFNVAP